MRIKLAHILLAAILMIISGGATLHAQKYPERRNIRAGNKDYEQGAYPQSEVDYRRALEKKPDSYEALFNLGNSLYKQERYEESAQIFQQLAQDTARAGHIAQCHYNAGNALFQQRKLQEALEAYKNSLRRNPADMDAKFNLAYVKKMLEDQEGDGGGDNDQDQNQDGQDDRNQDNQQDKGDQDKGDNQDDKQDKGDQDEDKGKNEDKPREGQQPQQQGMTEAEAEQMLDAMQAQEDRTQDKVDEKKKGVAVGRSGRNW